MFAYARLICYSLPSTAKTANTDDLIRGSPADDILVNIFYPPPPPPPGGGCNHCFRMTQ